MYEFCRYAANTNCDNNYLKLFDKYKIKYQLVK